MEIVSPEKIRISQQTVSQPNNAYAIKEQYFGVTTYNPESGYPYILTTGLYTCKGVTFYEPAAQKGLLSHLGIVENGKLKQTMGRLVQAFGGTLEKSEVHVVAGTVQDKSDEEDKYCPTVEEILSDLTGYYPMKVLYDDELKDVFSHRHIALDLETGQVLEFSYKFEGLRDWNFTLNQSNVGENY